MKTGSKTTNDHQKMLSEAQQFLSGIREKFSIKYLRLNTFDYQSAQNVSNQIHA